MADKRKHIDELARELMQPYQEEAPTAKVWSGIRRGMFFHNLTRKVWFWLGTSCVLLCLSLILGGGFNKYFGHGETPHYSQRADFTIAERTTPAQQPQQSESRGMASAASENHSNTNEAESSKEAYNNKSTSGFKNSTRSESSGNNASVANISGSSLSENNAAENHSSDKLISENERIKITATAESDHSNSNQKGSSGSSNETPPQASDKSTASNTETASDKKTNTQSSSIPKENNVVRDEDNDAAKELIPGISATEAEQQQKSMLAFARPISVSAELFASYHNSRFTLDKLDDQSETLLKIRKDGETPDWSYSAGFGLRLDYSLFFLQAEANYLAYRNTASYKWTEDNITKDEFWKFDTLNYSHIDTINAYYDSINATWHYEMDTINQQQIDSTLMITLDTMQQNRHVRTFQELQYWEFPLLIGHSWSLGNWDLEASTGIAVGFFTGSSGKIIINRDYQLVDYDEQNLPFRDARLIWIGRAGAAYRIDDRWSILGRASIRYSLNSVFEDSYNISQKPYSLGVSLGVRFKL